MLSFYALTYKQVQINDEKVAETCTQESTSIIWKLVNFLKVFLQKTKVKQPILLI